jgi:hypothetical protein
MPPDMQMWVKLYSISAGRGVACPLAKEILYESLKLLGIPEDTPLENLRVRRFIAWKKSGTIMLKIQLLTKIPDVELESRDILLKNILLAEEM